MMQLLEHKDLKPGDILLFLIQEKNPSIISRLIKFGQSLTSNNKYNLTHAGICSGIGASSVPIITHLREGLVQQPITDIVNTNRDSNRVFLVYRHKDAKVSQEIAKVASEVALQKEKPKWTISVALRAMIAPPKMKRKEHETSGPSLDHDKKPEISHSSICSKFVAEVIETALRTTSPHKPGLDRSTVNVLDLEEQLAARQSEYSSFCCPGAKNPLHAVATAIEYQLSRLETKHDKSKYQECLNMYVKTVMDMDAAEKSGQKLDDLQKAQKLLDNVAPILAKHRSVIHIGKTKSYKTLVEESRKVGVYVAAKK